MKRLLVFTFLFVFALQAIGFAAVGGSKPKVSSPPTQAPTTKQAAPAAPAPDASSGYKPSAPASSYSEKAPATAAKPGTAPAQQPSSGGFMRNMALFGGGMMLGGLLGNMFGFGAGSFFAEMIGMLFNVMLLAGVFMGARFLWNKYKQNQEEKKRASRDYRDY